MILGHHGLGEELLLYAAAAGGGAGSAAALVWRVQLSRLMKWLRRR